MSRYTENVQQRIIFVVVLHYETIVFYKKQKALKAKRKILFNTLMNNCVNMLVKDYNYFCFIFRLYIHFYFLYSPFSSYEIVSKIKLHRLSVI